MEVHARDYLQLYCHADDHLSTFNTSIKNFIACKK